MWSNTCYNSGLGSFQKWWIGNEIRTLLLADSGISEMVGVDVYPVIAPENTNAEFIVYRRTAYRKETVKEGVYEDVCNMEIVAVSDKYDNALALAEMIDNCLTGKHETDEGEKFSMLLVYSSEGFDDNKYFQKLSFEIK